MHVGDTLRAVASGMRQSGIRGAQGALIFKLCLVSMPTSSEKFGIWLSPVFSFEFMRIFLIYYIMYGFLKVSHILHILYYSSLLGISQWHMSLIPKVPVSASPSFALQTSVTARRSNSITQRGVVVVVRECQSVERTCTPTSPESSTPRCMCRMCLLNGMRWRPKIDGCECPSCLSLSVTRTDALRTPCFWACTSVHGMISLSGSLVLVENIQTFAETLLEQPQEFRSPGSNPKAASAAGSESRHHHGIEVLALHRGVSRCGKLEGSIRILGILHFGSIFALFDSAALQEGSAKMVRITVLDWARYYHDIMSRNAAIPSYPILEAWQAPKERSKLRRSPALWFCGTWTRKRQMQQWNDWKATPFRPLQE